MDNCTQCLMLKDVRKLKIEQISFTDSEENPAYCRACYQRERAEKKRLKDGLIKIRKSTEIMEARRLAEQALQGQKGTKV